MTNEYHESKSPGADDYTRQEPRLPSHPFPFPRHGDIPSFPYLKLLPFLVIRASAADDGTRPIASLGGGSTDISIDGPTTTLFTLTNIAHLVPAPGSEQSIIARIWNFGSDGVVTARVRFWEVRTLQGTEPEPELIGSAFGGVPAQSSVLVKCPEIWRPTNPSRVSVMVDVSDTVHDPISTPFDPFTDRHVAQKVIVSQ